MLTPEGPPPYTTPVRPLDRESIDEELTHHIMSLPEKDQCDNYMNSMLYIGEDLGQLHIQDKPRNPAIVAINVPGAESGGDSSPEITQAPHALKQGWMDGIFGCLRPMLSMIGKGGVNEIKGSQDDWEISYESITIIKYLGSGGQGMVNLGYLNNELVAVKKVSEEKDTDIRYLRKLDHRNIIKFKGVSTTPPCFAIVMEFCPHGSLYDILKCEDKVVTPVGIVSWAKQIASGMAYVHAHKIIHRDLKSLNILIGENEIIKISDFGTSRVWNEVSMRMSFNGTVAWMAPEALREDRCSEKVDIWSFGIVLWELLTREPPFRDLEQTSIIFLVGSGKLQPLIPSTCPDGFKLIMQMCWKFSPKERPSFKLICKHLEIAAVEILSTYKEEQFYKTQESWKAEVTDHITQFKLKHQEYQLHEVKMKRQRELEKRHMEDVKKQYYNEVKELQEKLRKLKKEKKRVGRAKDLQCKRRIMPFVKNLNRGTHRQNSQNSTTPTSPECTSTSPDSPQVGLLKAPLYAQLNASSQPESVTMATQTQSAKQRKRHSRTNSASTRTSACSCSSSNRTSILVDTETQTDNTYFSEIDSYFPSGVFTGPSANPPQRVFLQEIRDNSNSNSSDESCNGNSVQIHYMVQQKDPAVQIFTRADSADPVSTPDLTERADSMNQNLRTNDFSDDDNLESMERQLAELISDNGNMSDNGNLSDDMDALRIRTGESRTNIDSTEEYPNDSFTDEEGEVNHYNHLRRRSLARRPIYPGRRSNRFKYSLNHNRETNISDEGNTSEYSNSPSSKSSTLESNPDRARTLPTKRPNDHSDGSSDSESEDNMTIATQLCFAAASDAAKKPESVV